MIKTHECCLDAKFSFAVQFLSPTLLAIFLKFLSFYNPKFAGKQKEKESPRSRCESSAQTDSKKRSRKDRKKWSESCTIEMSNLESTPVDKDLELLKAVAKKDRRPSKAPGLADLTGFRQQRERGERNKETRRKREEEAIDTVVEVHSAHVATPAPAPAPAPAQEIYV